MVNLLEPETQTRVQTKTLKERRTNKKQRRDQNRATPPKGFKLRNWIIGYCVIFIVGTIVYFQQSKASFHQPKTFQELLSLTPSQINKCDVGLINILCAEGLVGSENLNVEECLKSLDEVALEIKEATEKAMPRYYQEPSFHKNYSVNQFKIMVMGSYVQRKLKWTYNPELAWPPDRATERMLQEKMQVSSKNVFLIGLVDKPHFGTCSSLPSLWVTLGTRLGYPLYTVQANTHGFARWDDGKERFNFEIVDGGASFPPDERYLEWPFSLTQNDLATGHYLKSQTPVEAFAYFLGCRMGFLWRSRDREGVAACALKIHELVPNDREFMKSVWFARRALTPPTPRELNSPRTSSERLSQQLVSLTEPGSFNPLHPKEIRVYDEKEDQLQTLRESGVDERTIAIVTQSIPDPQPDSFTQRMPSIDPLDMALRNMPPQVRGHVKAAMQGNLSLAGNSEQDGQSLFPNLPVRQYPIDKTWSRYEE